MNNKTRTSILNQWRASGLSEEELKPMIEELDKWEKNIKKELFAGKNNIDVG